MTKRQSTPDDAVLVAIDIAKMRNEVLVQAEQLCGSQARRLAAIDDGFHDGGGEPGKPEGRIDVGRADALGSGDVVRREVRGPYQPFAEVVSAG